MRKATHFMKKVTARFITRNIKKLLYGDHIINRGNEYWVANDYNGADIDLENGTIYYLTVEDRCGGRINGKKYGRIINGVAYKYVDKI